MRKVLWATLFLVMLLTALPDRAQSPNYQVGPNYAALDQLDAKAATVAASHYGSRDAMLEAAKKRNELRALVASRLAREVTPK